MSNLVKVDWRGELNRFQSRAGNQIELAILYVHLPSEPYPVRLEFFDAPPYPPGIYEMPLKVALSMDRRSLQVSLDYSKAKQLEK